MLIEKGVGVQNFEPLQKNPVISVETHCMRLY
jgi:hypothetical protein